MPTSNDGDFTPGENRENHETRRRLFLSWSGPVSGQIADIVKDLLREIFGSTLEVWKSNMPENTGTFWRQNLENALKTHHSAIICVTPQNCRSPWLSYELGAFSSKQADGMYVFLWDDANTGSDILKDTPFEGLQFPNAKGPSGRLFEICKAIKARHGLDVNDDQMKSRFDQAWNKQESRFKWLTDDTWTIDSADAKGRLTEKFGDRSSHLIQEWLVYRWECVECGKNNAKGTTWKDKADTLRVDPLESGRDQNCWNTSGLAKAFAVARGNAYVVLKGPLGMGKSVLLYRYFDSEESGPSESKRLVDAGKLLAAGYEPDSIRTRLGRSLKTFAKGRAGCRDGAAVVILDGLDTAVRQIAVQRGLVARDEVRKVLTYVFDALDALRNSNAMIIFSMDDSPDGYPTSTAEPFIDSINARATEEHKEFSILELAISEREIERLMNRLQSCGFGINPGDLNNEESKSFTI